LLKLLYK